MILSAGQIIHDVPNHMQFGLMLTLNLEVIILHTLISTNLKASGAQQNRILEKLIKGKESECFSLSLFPCLYVQVCDGGCVDTCVADSWKVWILHIKHTPATVHTINLFLAATGVLWEHTGTHTSQTSKNTHSN